MGTSSEGPVAGRLQIVCSRIRRKIQGLATPEDHPIYNMHAFRRPLTPYRREQAREGGRRPRERIWDHKFLRQ